MKKLLCTLLTVSFCSLFAETLLTDVRDNFDSTSVCDKKNNIISKTNHLGYTIFRSQAIPVENGKIYAGRVSLEILKRSLGSILSVRLVTLNSDKLQLKAFLESSGNHQTLFGCGKRDFIRYSPANHNAKFMCMEVIIAGNPADVKIDSVSIKQEEPLPKFPGIYTKKEPYPNRDEVIASLEKIQPATAKVVRNKYGRTVVMLDGKETFLKSYKGSIDYRLFGEAGANFIVSFCAGVNLFWDKHTWDMATMQPDGSFDFSRLEKELLLMHHAAPNVRVLLNIDLDPGQAFFEKYPDSIFRNEKGELAVRRYYGFGGFGVPGPNPLKHRHWVVSYASEDYLRYAENGLRQVAEFLKKSPAGKIVAGFGIHGGHDGQMLQWEYSSYRGQGDYSPDAIKTYRKWLKTQYKDDKALQQAWEDDSVTLETAPLFSEKEWKSRKYYSAAKTGLDRKITDGRNFMTWSLAELNRRFARVLKESFGRDVIVGTYYSTPIWGQAGRSSLAELKKDNGIDVVFQVSGYSYLRQLGNIGASANFAIASAHAADMIFMQEMDHRTTRSQMTAPEYYSRTALCYPRTVEEYRNQIFRDAGSVLAYGGDGYYYYDMFDSWFNDPQIKEIIRVTNAAADWSVQYRDRVPKTKVALFLDEKHRLQSRDVSGGGSKVAMAFRLSGLTPDIYLLNDLTRKDLPEYDLYVVSDPQTISEAELEALEKLTSPKGKVLLLTGSVGALNNSTPGKAAQTLKKYFDINVEDITKERSDFVEFIPGVKDPLLDGCIGKNELTGTFASAEKTVICSDIIYSPILNDPSFKLLGQWNLLKKAALGVRRSKDSGTLIYSASGEGLSPVLLHNAAKEAGILPHTLPGNSISVGNGIISIHRLDKPVEVFFDVEMEFFDPADGKKLGEGKVFKTDMPLLASKIVCYKVKEK